jgi:catechol 2,3-dioxygenase-like lactoylglutathione lyase family enzyme
MKPDGYMPILIVSDLARSRAFYEDVMGFQYVDGDDTSAFFRCGDDVFVLNNYAGAEMMMTPDAVDHESRTAARTINSTGVESVDAVYEELASKGVEFIRPPEDRWWGKRVAFFRDPDGHVWEIHQDAEGDDANR